MTADRAPRTAFELETLDLAYNVRRGVGPRMFDSIMAEYRAASERATAGLPGARDVRYDDKSGERLDIWGADGETMRPVFLFLHGGYWRALSRHDSAFMAGMLHDHGIATVVPDYTLAPAATLEEIVRQVRACVDWIWRRGAHYGLDRTRIVVGGSSAGGHLAAMIAAGGWQDRYGLPDPAIAAALPVSGLFDLRDLIDVHVNDWLGLDPARAAALSPAFQPPGGNRRLVLAAAGLDGAGFHTQSRNFALQRPGAELLFVPGRNHFDVILDWQDPDTALSRALLGLFGR